jgi:hypothetical protein
MTTSQHERVNGANPMPPPAPHRPSRAERLAADAAAKAERDRILDEARRERARRQEQWVAERDQLREQRRRTRKTSNDTARRERITAWQARLQKWWHAFVLVGAIVGVNIVAVVGQVTAFSASTEANGFGWSPLQAIATAAVIETIAIYVGWHAHTALIEGDSVMRLRVTSYAIALGVGALNYYHYAPTWKFDDQAVMFGGASVLSPWLWAMHSRHQHRQALREQGLIDPRAPKFSALRWLLWRSETWTALRWAVRYGEQSPGAAILAVQGEAADVDTMQMLDRTRDQIVVAQCALIRAQGDALKVMELVTSQECPAFDEVTVERPIDCPPEVPELPPPPVSELVTSQNAEGDQANDRERPDEQDNREAETWIRRRMRGGRTPTQKEVCEKYSYSKGWARLRVQAARDEMTAKGYRFLPGNVVQPPAETATSSDAGVTAAGGA